MKVTASRPLRQSRVVTGGGQNGGGGADVQASAKGPPEIRKGTLRRVSNRNPWPERAELLSLLAISGQKPWPSTGCFVAGNSPRRCAGQIWLPLTRVMVSGGRDFDEGLSGSGA
jgi:hypothetical protein